MLGLVNSGSELQRLRQELGQLRRAERRHRLLLRINNATVSQLTRDALFDAIAEVLRDAIPLDRASIAMMDRAASTVRVYALAGHLTSTLAPIAAERTPNSLGGLLTVLETLQPVVFDDLAGKRHFSLCQAVLTVGLRLAPDPGSVRSHTSQTTKASRMISACHRYR